MEHVPIMITIAMSLLLVKCHSSAIPDSPHRINSEFPTLVVLEQYLPEISARRDDVIRFGTQILDDKYGNKVGLIEEDHKSLFSMTREICRQWLAGKGKQPVSWNILIGVLEQIQLNTLAGNIKNSLIKDIAGMYQNAVKILKTSYSNQKIIQFDLSKIIRHTSFLEIVMKGDNNSEMHVPHWQSVFNETSVSQRLLITGRPGSGKTTLLRYLAKEWTEGRALHFCQILFLINLGQLRSRGLPAWNSLTDMLTKAFADVGDIQRVASGITSNNGAGACFLLDAYNEWYPNDYVHDLFFQNILSNSFCVLTSRVRFHEENSGLQFKHIKMIGFPYNDLDRYVAILANNRTLTQSVLALWSKYPDVRDMCTLPLHLAMVVFIMRHESTPILHTRAQIYMAFVNATIIHYRHLHHPHWNTVSLRHCLLRVINTRSTRDDDLCTAFQTLHSVAFKILFNRVYTFPDYPDIRRNIERLNFVDIEVKPSTSDLVQYTFSHSTFLEFFAILHLTTLSRNEQLMYIDLFGREQNNNNMISLFVELIDNLHQNEVYQEAETLPETFQPIFTLTNVTALNYSTEVVTQVYDSKQIDSESSVSHSCTYDMWNQWLLKGVLNQTAFHRVLLKGETSCMNYSIVVEDWNQTPLQYFDLLHFCLSHQTDDCRQFTKAKILHMKHLASQTCVNDLFKIIRKYLTHLSLIEVTTNIENASTLNEEIDSLIDNGIKVEIAITVDCEWKNIVKHLELLSIIKGLHIISECKFCVVYRRLWIFESIVHLPQYETLNISGSIPFLIHLLHGQTQLKHLCLYKVYFNEITYKDHFFRYIRSNPYLQTLEIVHSAFGDKEVKELLNYLPDTLHALNLDGNKLTDEIITELSSTLWNFPELNYLSLKYNEITGNGIKFLISALKSKRSFQYLDLSNNPIDEQYFTEFLHLESLEYLAVDGCHVLNNKDLLSNLAHSLPKLQCLHLCNNQHKVDAYESTLSTLTIEPDEIYPIYTSCCSIGSPTSLSASPSGAMSTQNLSMILWLRLDLYLMLMHYSLFLID
jgi:hypothetical protein